MKKEIVDIIAGTVETVEMTSDEIKAYEDYKAKADAEISHFITEQTKTQANKKTLLDKLGITEDEARLLLS
jgi:hypothetical protein